MRPELPLPVGLSQHLSRAAAARIQTILDDPTIPKHAGKEMQTADASVLLGRPYLNWRQANRRRGELIGGRRRFVRRCHAS